MSDHGIELTGANALSAEEVRVLTCGQPYAEAPDRDKETWRSAIAKVNRAREVSQRPPLHGGGSPESIHDKVGATLRELPMFGGYSLYVGHDAAVANLAYFTVVPPERRRAAGAERPLRATFAATPGQLEELLSHLPEVRDHLRGPPAEDSRGSEAA